MQFGARLADGHRVGLPICAPAALQRAFQANLEAHGPWWIETQNHAWRGDELLWIYGLHEMCGHSWDQVAERIERPASFARRRARKHKELMLTDAEYQDRAQQIVCKALGPAGGRT